MTKYDKTKYNKTLLFFTFLFLRYILVVRMFSESLNKNK